MDKRFGLDATCLEDIVAVFKLYTKVEEAIIFGSRAKGTYQNGSDVDIAIKGVTLTFDDISDIRIELDNLPYAYTYDVINYHKITSQPLAEHIDELGITFYKKAPAPLNWKPYKLKELAELRKEGYMPNGEDIPYIGLEHIDQQTLRLNSIGSSTNVSSNKFKFQAGDILYGKLRPYFRKVYRPMFNGVCSTDIYVIKNKKPVTQKYLFYLTATKEFTDVANSGSSGTRMPRADWKQLEDHEWIIPESTIEQDSIAQILSCLDAKIELNIKMNQTLETMAQVVFNWCFNLTETEDWEPYRLGELIEIKGGLSYRSEHIGSGDTLILGMGCVSFNERFQFSGARAYSGDYGDNHLVKPGDIVIATRQQSDNLPILGFPAKVPTSFENKKVIVGANLYKVVNKSRFDNSLLFQLLKSEEYKKHIKANSKGSTVRMITKDSIEQFKLRVPPSKVSQPFEAALKAIDVKLEVNLYENQVLTQIRDTLLPKLISGNLEIQRK